MGDQLLLLKLPCIQFAYRGMIANDIIGLRLRKRGFIAFIMAPTPIANQVNQNVLMKVITKGVGNAYGHQTCMRIVRIHMNDGNFKAFRQITSEMGRTTILWQGSKAKLIIRDNMNGSAHPVTIQTPHIERFRHNALAGERGITMDENGKRLIDI